jgi:glutamate--cysteine ligase
VCELAKDCLGIAHKGLARRARLDIGGRDESRHLETLDDIVARSVTPAEELIEKFKGPWGGSVEPVFTEDAY